MDLIVKFLITICFVSPFVSCSNKNRANLIETDLVYIDTIGGLIFYHPKFDEIAYYTNTSPSENDTSIIFCCTASFTKHRLFSYEINNISGPYVSTDVGYCEGYNALNHPIAFIYENNQWRFQKDSIESTMRSCAQHNGIAFTQMDIFPSDSYFREKDCDFKKNHTKSKNIFSDIKIRMKGHRYRVLCERNDSLFIAESIKPCTYDEFVLSLCEVGIKKAIYLDCGFGWSYGWYRINSTSVKFLHWLRPPYISNWIVFKKFLS